ncbi:MAG TPA: response regulator [Thermoanaerobaculia bacterium]|nr:response regulator [Thermoanaerobaculia bacterium]
MPTAKILVVEDSPTELNLTTSALQSRGFRVATATDGDEAWRKIREDRPDLILLDVLLPGKNGFQICREIKTKPETQGIKVVLVTGKNQESDRFWGMRQGADEYLTKPFSAESLLAVVSRQVA